MTRASLLHILDNLGGISETEVQELEQLAATFPYCQTAHLLLAKAAHDRGSMLAAQRLRRAATYAVDRQQLRALIELPAPLPPAQASAATIVAQGEAESSAPLATTDQPTPVESIAAEPERILTTANTDSPEIALQDNQSLTSADITEELDTQGSSAGTIVAVEEATIEIPSSKILSLDNALATTSQASLETDPELEAPRHEVSQGLTEELSEATINLDVDSTEEENHLESSVEAEADVVALVEEAPDIVETEVAVEEPIEELSVTVAETADSTVVSELEVEPELTEPELPLAPAPIRPPMSGGTSRFEFGLAQTLPVAIPTYNLFEVEKSVPKPTTVVPPFWSDEEVGYAPGLGSRLGFCLQAHDEYTLDLPPSAFFEPDALLLQHLKQHQPVPPPVPTSIDLIDKFLRSKPRFRAPLPLPPTTEAQADLSVRSTLAEPSLASESLARILVRQGKITKAIEIYERLIVRQPEKKAYFADQIQQLQTFE